MLEILLAYLHYLGVAALFALLFAEMQLFRPDLDLAGHRRLVWIDLGYGAAATVVLVTGLARVFLPGKGMMFYFSNLSFHIMGALFLAAAVLSLYPTRRLVLRWRGLRDGGAPPLSMNVSRRLRHILRVELVLLLLALLFAVLMARGIGWKLGVD